MPHDVFISYSAKDKIVADAACATLEQHQIRCWIAPRDVIPGVEYGDALLTAITECHVFLLVFSSHADGSPQVRREVERAVAKGKIILPFRIEEVLPSKALEFCIGNTHWLDALTPPLEAHLARLVPTVQHLLKLDFESSVKPAESAFTRAARMPSQKSALPQQNMVSPVPNSITPRVSQDPKEAKVVIKVDRRLNNAGKGKTLRMPYVADRPVYDFLDEIYYFIAPAVPQFSYGVKWTLVDVQTGKELNHLKSGYDEKPLGEGGIAPGAVLLVKPL